jgi:hypothetical protein
LDAVDKAGKVEILFRIGPIARPFLIADAAHQDSGHISHDTTQLLAKLGIKGIELKLVRRLDDTIQRMKKAGYNFTHLLSLQAFRAPRPIADATNEDAKVRQFCFGVWPAAPLAPDCHPSAGTIAAMERAGDGPRPAAR